MGTVPIDPIGPAVVVEKSLVEGIGLTVTEPKWKGKAVLALSRRRDPEPGPRGRERCPPRRTDGLRAFGRALRDLLEDEDRRVRIGAAARERVREQFDELFTDR